MPRTTRRPRERVALEQAVSGGKDGDYDRVTARLALSDWYREHGHPALAAEQLRLAGVAHADYVVRVREFPYLHLGLRFLQPVMSSIQTVRMLLRRHTVSDARGVWLVVLGNDVNYVGRPDPRTYYWERGRDPVPELAPYERRNHNPRTYDLPPSAVEVAAVVWRPEVAGAEPVDEIAARPAAGALFKRYLSASTLVGG